MSHYTDLRHASRRKLMHRTGTDWLVGRVIDSVMTSPVGQEESDLRMLLYSSGFMRIVSLFPYSGKVSTISWE